MTRVDADTGIPLATPQLQRFADASIHIRQGQPERFDQEAIAGSLRVLCMSILRRAPRATAAWWSVRCESASSWLTRTGSVKTPNR